MPHPYQNARIAFLTQHEKESVVAPVFASHLGATVEAIRHFNTDTLGTFTRDIPRAGSQLEAARKKASLAVELSGGSLGLGSEGALVPGLMGFGSMHLEVLLLLDAQRGVEYVEYVEAPGWHLHGVVSSLSELEDFANKAQFPSHGLVVRPEHENHSKVIKGLRRKDELIRAFMECSALSTKGSVFIENDLRAHQHPTRMKVIEQVAHKLITRVMSLCPACALPGYGRTNPLRGLPCEDCGSPTEQLRAWTWACVKCEHRHIEELSISAGAPARFCGFCNP